MVLHHKRCGYGYCDIIDVNYYNDLLSKIIIFIVFRINSYIHVYIYYRIIKWVISKIM